MILQAYKYAGSRWTTWPNVEFQTQLPKKNQGLVRLSLQWITHGWATEKGPQKLILFLLLVFTAQHSCWASPFNTSGFLNPFHFLGLFGLFHSLGILGPFHSFLPLSFSQVFAKSFKLPWPNYHILCLWVYWPVNQSHLPIPFFGLLRPLFAFFLFLMILMSLLLHSFGLSQPVCFLWAHLLFCGLMDQYSYHSRLMIFTLLLSFSTFFILLGFFCHWTILSRYGQASTIISNKRLTLYHSDFCQI